MLGRGGLVSVLVGALLVSGVGQAPASAVVTGPEAWKSSDPSYTAPAAVTPVFGVNYQPMWGTMTDTARARVLDELAAAGVQWVRIDVSWASLQPSNATSWDMSWGVPAVDKRIREIRARGMKVLLMFYWAPSWATGTTSKAGRPRNPADYANAAAWVAKRYNGTTVAPDLKIEALELWNEPDLDRFWAPDPTTTRISDFATLIKTAGPKVKAANPDLTVVVGATSTTDPGWYTEFYKTPGVIGTYDALGYHPYQSPGDATPEAFDPKWAKYYMRNTPALDTLMTNAGDPATLWATEFGWTSHDNSTYGGTANTPNYAKGVTPTNQADYLLRSMNVLTATPRVKAAFWYNAWNTQTGDAMQDNFGILNVDFTRKPAWYALRCAAATICGPTTPTTPTTPTPEPAPAAPTGLTTTTLTPTQATLTWTPTTGAQTYTLYRNGTPLTTTTTTTHTDTTLTPTTTYTYTLTATNTTGTSPTSTPHTITTPAPAPAPTTLVTAGSTWKFFDRGTDLGTAWREAAFNDTTWKAGPAQLGYGDGDEKTLLAWGTDANRKPITNYLRTTFDAGSDISAVTGLTLRALVDDAAVVYLNGVEVWRFNLPTGAITYTTRASKFIAGADETLWRTAQLASSALRPGINTVAVEVHNDKPSSSDVSFDLSLTTRVG